MKSAATRSSQIMKSVFTPRMRSTRSCGRSMATEMSLLSQIAGVDPAVLRCRSQMAPPARSFGLVWQDGRRAAIAADRSRIPDNAEGSR